jgi:ubiquinone biosynthesis protein COQ9
MDMQFEAATDETAEAARRRIVQAALRLAVQGGGWDPVHVHDVAREAGITMQELARHCGDKDAIAEAFFDGADAALLSACEQPGWLELPARERLCRAIMAWLDALEPHHRLVVDMLGYKLHPEHLHLQARGIARISRTVQWIREVAMLPSVGWRRELEEATLTTIYLVTFSTWMRDRSAGAQRTRRLLERLLTTAERGSAWLGYRG